MLTVFISDYEEGETSQQRAILGYTLHLLQNKSF